MGNLFQISNQTTLGEKEDEIIERLSKVIETIIEKEHDARQMLIQKKSNTLLGPDRPRLWRLYFRPRDDLEGSAQPLSDHQARRRSRRVPGRLAACRSTSSSSIRSRPILQKSSQQKLNAEERDHLRAQIIRERLRVFPNLILVN